MNCPIKNIYATEQVPPILPGKIVDLDHLRTVVESYLCNNCCNYRIIRNNRTAPGCVDVYEIRANEE